MAQAACQILVTGAQGFIGKNICVHLQEHPGVTVIPFLRGDDPASLAQLVKKVDAVIHLAGENRPVDPSAFDKVNSGLTTDLCDAIIHTNEAQDRQVPLVLASSTQAALDNPYGRSKLAAEETARAMCNKTGNPAAVFRLPGVFGKWCKPNYNSVVATFCHNIAHGLPIRVDDPDAQLRLAYIDDVVAAMMAAALDPQAGFRFAPVSPDYSVKLGALAAQIEGFSVKRMSQKTDRVGTGLTRALYATYLSYLPHDQFTYELRKNGDSRGAFVEVLKTADSGQFSYFTAPPGSTRGEHYHHTKAEKFVVVKGTALFRFRHVVTNEMLEIFTTADAPRIVESIPGWVHSVSNTGQEDLIVMLWANEVFDHSRPDTFACKVAK